MKKTLVGIILTLTILLSFGTVVSADCPHALGATHLPIVPPIVFDCDVNP